jgi:hypothetical protein
LFDLLNASGEWLVTVRVPAATGEVADVSAEKLLTIWRDPFDVPYLRVYSLPATF